jgi:small subunit ribosomal protein S1
VVLSERAAQAEAGTRIKLLDSLEEDTCVPGVVTTLTDFGAFVDLGGMEGLIHISELSWGRVDHPSDVVAIGDQIEVYILNIDRKEHNGAFVRLEEGVDGLIHISELGGNGEDLTPWDILEENQKVSVEIIHLDPEEQRLGLSLAVGD